MSRIDSVSASGLRRAGGPADRRSTAIRVDAGPLSGRLAGGELRYLKVGREELIRRVYLAVRDQDWGTLDTQILERRVKRRRRRFSAKIVIRTSDATADLVWTYRIDGDATGRIELDLAGRALRDSRFNRAGLCVLLPASLAGRSCRFVRSESPEAWQSGTLPDLISPHQPFADLTGFAAESASGVWVNFAFSGETFEMEDQRNWSDASFKMYCPPLAGPFPKLLAEGQEIVHHVCTWIDLPSERASGRRSGESAPGPRSASRRVRRGELTVAIGLGTEPAGDRRQTLIPFGFTIDELVEAARPRNEESAKLPVTLPDRELASGQLDAAAALAPGHLQVHLHTEDGSWEERLSRSIDIARMAGRPLWVHLAPPVWREAERFLRAIEGRESTIERLMFPAANLMDRGDDRAAVRDFVDAFRRRISGTAAGIGTSAWFAELNRPRPAVEWADFVFWSVTPQVHVSDTEAILETPGALADAVRTARSTYPDLGVCVGPITLRKRYNAYAHVTEYPLDPEVLRRAADPRQQTTVYAIYCLLALKYLSAAGATSATFGELFGERGLGRHTLGAAGERTIPSDDADARNGAVTGRTAVFEPFPAYHLFQRLSPHVGDVLADVRVGEPAAIDALAVRANGRLFVWAANLTGKSQSIRLQTATPVLLDHVARLGARGWSTAGIGSIVHTKRGDRTDVPVSEVPARLPPYSVSEIAVRLASGVDPRYAD